MSKVKLERMGAYLSTETIVLYYPYDRLVQTLDLKDYELDEYNRPVCLSNINHDFLHVGKLLYLILCEKEGYYEKLQPELKQYIVPFEFLLSMIGHARNVGLTTERILTVLNHKHIPRNQMFLRFQSQAEKIYVLEYGVMTSRPDVCTWKHPYLPVGSLIPGLSGTLKMLTGLDSLEDAITITSTLLNLEGKTRYYDVSTLKYRNGTEKAILHDPRYRIMCSSEVQHYHFFVGMLKYPEVMKSFQKWLKVLASTESIATPSLATVLSESNTIIPSNILKPETVVNASKPNKRKNIPKAAREGVWRRHSDNFIGSCWVCGDRIDYKSWHCAHIIPDCHGGLPSEENLVPACTLCNQSMKDMHMYDYMYMYHNMRLKRLGWTRESCPIVVTEKM